MYVAARGGEKAIVQAEALYRFLIGKLTAEEVKTIERTLPYLLDRVMGESSLYSPELAALGIAQTGGELFETVLLLRAYRTTQPRIAYAQVTEQHEVITVRRISAAFKDIPGGQVLGPTLDYSHRLLATEVLEGTPLEAEVQPAVQPASATYPTVADWQRKAGLLPEHTPENPADTRDIPDVTREPLLFPAPRAQVLQSLSRADSGGILALGYSNMRGYGAIHPTINEVRLGHAPVKVLHPNGTEFSIGEVRISQAEIVTEYSGSTERPELALGFSATLGWNETKTIAAGMLDMAMRKETPHPAQTEEFVLYHTEPVESSGFCIHFKLPHYVTFQSSLEAMRGVRDLNRVEVKP